MEIPMMFGSIFLLACEPISLTSLFSMAGLGVAGLGLMGGGSIISILGGFRANDASKQNASLQYAASNAAANTQRMAAAAQSQQLKTQAELAGMQAKIEQQKAGVAQEAGEIEQQRRMRLYAADIGNLYAQYAGNGLLVDGGADTLGNLLRTNALEAGEDIGVSKANTANEVWEHDMNRTAALVSQKSYLAQADSALSIGDANAQATLMSGWANAVATRQAGMTALYSGLSTGLTGLGGAALGGAKLFA